MGFVLPQLPLQERDKIMICRVQIIIHQHMKFSSLNFFSTDYQSKIAIQYHSFKRFTMVIVITII